METTLRLTRIQPSRPRLAWFSDEIDVQRRRKGSGPEGRADAPVRRGGGGDLGGGGGGGGWQPGGSGGGGGGNLPGNLNLPPWMLIILLILFILFGGGGALSGLFGGGGTDNSPTDTSVTEPPAAVQPVSNPPTTVPDSFTPQPVSKNGESWTVMLYQDADDQILEKDVFTDFNEAEMVGSSSQVNIVSQIDRFKGAFTGDGDWTGARRYYLTQDNDLTAIHSKLLADLGEVNMSDPATLVDFATWAIKTFPADHYVLILSDHGMGWPGGWTDGDSASSAQVSGKAPLVKLVGNALYTNQLDGALGQIRQQAGIDKFDIIGLDACLMDQLEVLSMLLQHASYAITSEETEPALGWAYTAFLQKLTQDPSISAADLSKDVVQSYIDGDERLVNDQARNDYLREMGGGRASAAQMAQAIGKDVTLSAVDLSKLPALMQSVNDLAYGLQNEDQPTIAQARDYALSFTNIFGKQVPPAYIDLGSFVQILKKQSSNQKTQALADAVSASIKQAVIAEKNGPDKQGASGVAIYFPNSSLYRSPYTGPQSYTVVAGAFAKQSLWDDFLAFYYNDQSFEATSRSAAVPPANAPKRSPGSGLINISKIKVSSSSAAPKQPVTLSADISGTNIGYIYLFIGYYDKSSNSIAVVDTDYLESPQSVQVDGVYYPKWSDSGQFTMKFSWDPTVFSVSDGQKTTLALFNPQQYGASAAEAMYSTDGIYTFADSGQQVNARLNFRNGQLVSIFGQTGAENAGAPRQITPHPGDTFTLLQKWLELNQDGSVKDSVYEQGETLTIGDQPLKWVEQYAPVGDYLVGFVVSDLDGNTKETYTNISVK